MDTSFEAGMPPHPAENSERQQQPIERSLGLWDAVSIIVGIIIGVGIFEMPPKIFASVNEAGWAIGLWVLGGALAFIGALCFAELSSAYPRSGGEYVYITRAFGKLPGFLFAWSQLSVTRSGSIASMAYIFGKHASLLFGFDDKSVFMLAALSVVVLTIVNILGVKMGTITQNVLTIAKVLGLAVLMIVGLGWGGNASPVAVAPAPGETIGFALALAFVLWAYSGWHEAAYVVAEAKNHTRNIPLALMTGTAVVTVIYVLVNVAMLYGLGFDGAKDDHAADNLVDLAWPGFGARAMNVLIMVSALGAINGMIFTTARIYSEFGLDHRIFKTMSHWSRRWRTPARALAVQGIICLGMIAGVGFSVCGDPFDRTVKLTVAVFWAFFCLAGVALIVLRESEPEVPRPFRVPLYPVLPIIFCGSCAYIVVKTILDDIQGGHVETLIGVGILLLGLPLYFLPQKFKHHTPEPKEEDLHALSK